ncbi:MAG TPA: Crp/Fnr family transcriptional regulator [Myxococcota bacterium]|nr:Crp/Fnr family transcriptional regulator [Myxococcota bacterium]HRY94802.1 Crp/Fnr family transcriptional regulator [Myxococcota bacterium]HSA21936.1 Crp/Fnr family transcriptional regulator [Myxococcota bacterium]
MSSDNERLFERFGREFPAGTVVFREGDVGNEMYVIQAGKVNITKKSRDVETVLVTLGLGAFFGEMAIINQKPRSASAVVLEDARLLVIGPKTFEAMIRGNSEIAVRMIKILAQRLQEADEQIENLLIKDHNSRVVHYLTHMASRGKAVAGGILVQVTQEDLAVKVGLKVHEVKEVLDKLLRARLIRVDEGGGGGALIIHEVNRLREFLEFLEMKEKFGDI